MPSDTKDRKINVSIPRDTDAWLKLRAGSNQNKAGFVRGLMEHERAREKEKQLLAMFNEAAADVADEDREERESLMAGFAGRP